MHDNGTLAAANREGISLWNPREFGSGGGASGDGHRPDTETMLYVSKVFASMLARAKACAFTEAELQNRVPWTTIEAARDRLA